MFSHQRVRNLSIVTIYFLAYKVKLQIFTPKNPYPSLVGPFECIHTILLYIVEQEEDLSNKELLLNIRRLQDFMMKQQHSIDVLSAPAPEGNQYSKL